VESILEHWELVLWKEVDIVGNYKNRYFAVGFSTTPLPLGEDFLVYAEKKGVEKALWKNIAKQIQYPSQLVEVSKYV